MMYRFRFLLMGVFFAVVFSPDVMGQTDTVAPPTMMSSRLITLDDYQPDAVYGTAYRDLLNQQSEKQKRKTLFNRKGSKFILPAFFIAYGTAARFNQLPIRQFDFDIDHDMDKWVDDKDFRIDDYFEYGMPVVAYGLGFIPGIEARHNVRDRTLIMATSFLVMKGAVEVLKEVVPVERPRGGSRSFPSGHTAVTMWSAHIMFREYRDVSPWIGVGGYLMAGATGVFRIMSDAHWFSDVMMGAGIGLLSAEIGYMMLPVWHSLFGIKDSGKQMAAVPMITSKSIGLGFVYQF